MRRISLIVLISVGTLLLAAGISANKPRKFKKAIHEKKNYFDIKKDLTVLLEEEQELENEIEEELEELNDVEEETDEDDVDEGSDHPEFIPPEDDDEEDFIENPCEDKHCGPGRECVINEQGEGICQCLTECLEVYDERRKVCSNLNDTWPSDCQLHRMRCLCSSGSEQCINSKYKHVHIDYYGNCQKISQCQEEEMEDFPRRMREWLFNIMRDMADREELSEHYMKLELEAEEDDRKKWSMAAVWKWCTLDDQPKDRSVSRHELFPIRAPLYALEHCISPFLNGCDANDDHDITLKEWINCLELTDEHKEDLEDLCEDIRDIE